jgi:hypothetical protein
MELRFSRRKIMQGVGGAAVAQSLQLAADAAPAPRKWPIEEGPDTPKLCLSPNDGGQPLAASPQSPPPAGRAPAPGNVFGGFLDPKAESSPAGRLETSYQRIRQLGVTHLTGVNVAGPGGVWTEESVRRAVDSRQSGRPGGLQRHDQRSGQCALREGHARQRHGAVPRVHRSGRQGRAHRGGVQLLRAPRDGGLLRNHRPRELGVYGVRLRTRTALIDENGRVLGPLYRDADGKLTPETLAAFPNAKKVKFKDLPPLANEGAHNLDEMWANITYFLKAAIPAAEKAGVRMALHPNDPPAPISRGSQQIMGTLAGWKHLIGIVDSPANGITFDCGVTRELGEDAVATAEYFASRKRINHVHYRNVLVDKPYEKYQEVFIDAGMNDMFGVMKALVKNKYTGTIYPEHPRALDADRDRVGAGGRIGGYPGGGGYAGITFSVAYARAMMQAALES